MKKGFVILFVFLSATGLSATLLDTDTPFSTGRKRVVFQRATVIRFYKNGDVFGGTLRYDTRFMIQGREIKFAAHTIVMFHPGGQVKAGMLVRKTRFKIGNGKSYLFKGYERISFYANGHVESGVLWNNETLQGGKRNIVFMAKTRVQLFPSGMVRKGVPTVSLRFTTAGSKIELMAKKPVSFWVSGRIKSGYLNKKASLSNEDRVYSFKKGVKVSFYRNGFVDYP